MEKLEKAGFGTRLLAWLIDMVAIGILSFVITLIFAGVISVGEATNSGFLGFLTGVTAILLAAINFILQFLYFGFLWSRTGQSLGKIAMNIRVTRQDEQTLMSFFRAGLRGSVGYWISAAIFWLGFLWALIDSENEAWHDKIFDTTVVVPSPFEVKG